jgi:hypothetical protein
MRPTTFTGDAMEPALDPLRKDPRFHALAERVGLAEYSAAT